MNQPFNADLLLRMNTLNQELNILQTNTSLFMQTIRDEIQQQQVENQKSKQICELNTQSISELRWHLDQQVGMLYQKYEAQVNEKIKEFEMQQKQKEETEKIKLQELEIRLEQYDCLIETLDKKWESKSNDRYIASIIQKNLLTNQNIGQFIVDKVLKLTDEIILTKLNDHTKQIDERMTNQYHQISNFQGQVRKYEKQIEELYNQINLQKEFSQEFQKQQSKKISVLAHQNTLFKEVIQQQVHSIIEQSEQFKNQMNKLQDDLEKQFEDQQVKKSEGNDQFLSLLSSEQQKLRELEKKQEIIFRNENEINQKIEQIQSDYSLQNKQAQNQIITIDSEMKNMNFNLNDIQERINKITINTNNKQVLNEKQEKILQQPIEKFKPLLLQQPKIQKHFSLKDQIGQIEILFQHVQLLFTHIIKTYKQEKKLKNDQIKQNSDLSRNHSKEQIDNNDRPQYVFQQYCQQQKQEQEKQDNLNNDSKLEKDKIKIKSESLHQSFQQQLQLNLQPIYQGNEDYFGDTKLYFNNSSKPLYIQGKQHIMDIRPQIEMSQLSAKVKQISNMFCDSDLRSQLYDYQMSQRPPSGKKRLPKINSKSLNFSQDDQQQ